MKESFLIVQREVRHAKEDLGACGRKEPDLQRFKEWEERGRRKADEMKKIEEKEQIPKKLEKYIKIIQN